MKSTEIVSICKKKRESIKKKEKDVLVIWVQKFSKDTEAFMHPHNGDHEHSQTLQNFKA